MRHLTDLPPESLVSDEIAKGDVCRFIYPDHTEPCEVFPAAHWMVLGARVEAALKVLA